MSVPVTDRGARVSTNDRQTETDTTEEDQFKGCRLDGCVLRLCSGCTVTRSPSSVCDVSCETEKRKKLSVKWVIVTSLLMFQSSVIARCHVRCMHAHYGVITT